MGHTFAHYCQTTPSDGLKTLFFSSAFFNYTFYKPFFSLHTFQLIFGIATFTWATRPPPDPFLPWFYTWTLFFERVVVLNIRALIPAEVISHFLNVTDFFFFFWTLLFFSLYFFSSPHRFTYPERMFNTVHKSVRWGSEGQNTCFNEEDLCSFPGTRTSRSQPRCATRVPRRRIIPFPISKPVFFFVCVYVFSSVVSAQWIDFRRTTHSTLK